MNSQKKILTVSLASLLLMGAGIYSPHLSMIAPSSVTAASTSRPQMNVPFTVPSFQFVAWQNVAIPSTAFLSNATSAEITVKGAVYVAFSKARDQWNYIDLEGGVFNWSNNNKSGVTFTVSGETLALALQGGLYVRADSSDGLTLIIKNIGTGGDVDEPEVGPGDEQEPEEVTSYSVNLNEWSDIPISALGFGQHATSAKLHVINACYVRYSHKVNGQLQTLREFSWSDRNRNGVDYELTGDLLEEAKAGGLYIYVGGANGKTITLSITSEGYQEVDPEEPEQPTDPEEPEQPTDPEEPEQPTDPEEPEQPTDPEEPEQPTDPEEPELPTDPEQPSDSYGVTQRSTRTLSEWQDIQLTASLWNGNSDKAKATISGACYVKFTHRVNGSLVTLNNGEYTWNDQNKGGVHYEFTGSLLDEAKNGNIYVWVGGGSPINLVVTSYGQGGTPEDEAGDLPEGMDTSDIFDVNVRAYLIAKRAQLTDAPTYYFTIPDAEGKDINTVLFKDRSTNTADYHTATLQVVDKTEGGVEEFTSDLEIKVRGNSTADMVKRPYRLKLPKGEKHDLLGLGYSKRNWTMLANYVDPSMLRNALTYHIGKMVGMEFCPGYKFVDVVMNNEYRGLYQVSDHVEVGKKRINVNEDTGWYVEISRGDMIEEPSLYAGMLPMSIKNPEPKTEAETAALKQEVSAWFSDAQKLFFNSSREAFLDPQTGWRSMFDEESMVNYYVAVNMTGDYDGFMTVKLYREAAENGKMKIGPLWDKDLAFGNFSADNGVKLVEDMNNGQFGYYVQKLTADPGFMEKVLAKVQKLQSKNVEQKVQDYIDEMASSIAVSEELNQVRWPGHSSWIYSFGSYGEAVQQLKDYETNHLQFFFSEVENMYAAAKASAPGRDETTAIGMLTAQNAVLHLASDKGRLVITSATDRSVEVRNLSGAVVADVILQAGTRQSVQLPAGIYVVAGQKVVVR